VSKVVITGGAGFIGSQLGFALSSDYDVLLVDNMSAGHEDNLIHEGKRFDNFICADVRDRSMYEVMSGADYVFHFAGISALPVNQENPREAVDNNVSGTANILDACRMSGVKKLIFASTSAVYENNKTFPSKESDATDPDLIYAVTKKQCEMLCNSFSSTYNLNVACMRFFNVYGPHQDFRRKSPPLIGYIIKELMAGRSPVLHSDGKQRRDYVYVDDLVKLMRVVMESDSRDNGPFNVCSGTTASVEEIFEEIRHNMRSNIEATYRDPSLLWEKYPSLYQGKQKLSAQRLIDEVNKYAKGDPTLTRKTFRWECETTMQTGIKKTVEYALGFGGET